MPDDAQFDSRLLSLFQERIPLVREPYAQLAAELGCDESTLLKRLGELRGDGGLIREISGIFDAARLGYRQALVAFAVGETKLDDAGRVVAAHPGVSHCYARKHEWNLWFTLAVSPQSSLGLEATVERLAIQAGAERYMVLPVLRKYKLRVHLGEAATEDADEPGPDSPATPLELSDQQRRVVRALQQDLPNHADPFAPLAERAGLDGDALLVHAADLLAAGALRRYAAVLHHHRAGYTANLMVAWEVPPTVADAAGAKCAREPAVSHCYLRPATVDWPYNLYTMIHGRNPGDCEMTVDEIVAKTGLRNRAELWTLREYKKRRVPLFGEEEAAWEAQQQ